MSRSRDPIEARNDDDRDLYDVATWEVRTLFDRLAVGLYSVFVSGIRAFLVLLGLVLLIAQVVAGAVASVEVAAFTLLSVIPALALAAYVWYADVTTAEPLDLVAATFLLGVLFAGFAAVLNTATDVTLAYFGLTAGLLGFLVQIVVFFLVVGPVEEFVKLLAVRFYAYRSHTFDAVVDGAVYGAVAGLGFATIENAIYISGTIEGVSDPLNLVVTGSAITAVRALAGPGHVIYSAFAGYYLGLAKFNSERAGPIVVKGLLIAALIHATYNTLAGIVPAVAATVFGIPGFVAFVGFIVVYDGFFGLLLYRKLARYRRAYNETRDEGGEGPTAELTEFDG